MIRSHVVRTFLAVSAMLVPCLAHGQPPAPASAPPPPPPLVDGTVEFSFVGTTGNSSTQSIGLGGELNYRPDVWTIATKAAYVRNHTDDLLKAESIDIATKAARAIDERLSAFGRYAFLHDRFAGIEQRHVIEGGVAYLLVNQAPHTLTVDASLGYAHEARVVGDSLSNPTLALGALYRLKVNAFVDASDDWRFNASLSDGTDWRVANVAAVTSKLNTVLSLKASNTIRYVHAPVFGFRTTDTITAIALVAKF